MTRPRTLLLATAALALGACGEPRIHEPAAAPALERPSHTLSTRPGARVTVPQAALVTRAGVPGVFVLSGEGRARFRVVRTGKDLGRDIEILAGLRGDERLVLGDLAAVHDGSAIAAVKNAK
jgi:hypothetical protein